MHAELQVLSPLVSVRQLKFLRFCKQQAEGVWAVVDVSLDISQEGTNVQPFVNCRKLPSGFVVQDLPNGYSKVILDVDYSLLCCYMHSSVLFCLLCFTTMVYYPLCEVSEITKTIPFIGFSGHFNKVELSGTWTLLPNPP